MGCLVMAYGPVVRSWCSCLTVGAALHIVPSATLAQTVSTVAASNSTSPVTLAQVVCTASERQSALGRAMDSAVTMTTPMSTVDPNRLRARVAGARES